MVSKTRTASIIGLAICFLAGVASTQTDHVDGRGRRRDSVPGDPTPAFGGVVDPGVQSASRNTGVSLIDPGNDPKGFTPFFNDGLARFQTVESVSGGANNGLGPRFNLNQCSGCHAAPAIGGSGPANNPQFQAISDGMVNGRTNSIPSFITANGPTVEVRFPFFFSSNGSANLNSPNGGVEDLFTVSGRSDAGSCNLSQPAFAAARAANNMIFRIPTPTFGAGLI